MTSFVFKTVYLHGGAGNISSRHSGSASACPHVWRPTVDFQMWAKTWSDDNWIGRCRSCIWLREVTWERPFAWVGRRYHSKVILMDYTWLSNVVMIHVMTRWTLLRLCRSLKKVVDNKHVFGTMDKETLKHLLQSDKLKLHEVEIFKIVLQ